MPPDRDSTPFLEYDGISASKDKRAKFVVLVYCFGVLLTGVGYAVIGLLVAHGKVGDVSRWIDGVVFTFVFLLLAFISLGASMSAKQRAFKEVRFATYRKATAWGLITGVYPTTLFGMLGMADLQRVVVLGGLVWFFLIPAVAGLNLCYRSHLRE